ncbi:MAG: NUDIX domain-containing protein [Candidatus Levyibacteriota bacterium]
MQSQEKIGVPILVLNDKNEILIGKRVNSYGAGLWGIPGGRIELKEPMTTTVKRELEEETGMKAESTEFIGVVRGLQGDYSFIHFGFIVRKFSGEAENLEPKKCEGWEWISLDKLPDDIMPAHKAIIEMYLQPHSSRYRDLI